MSSYVIEFQDDSGVNAEVDLSDYVISPFTHHMMSSISGVRHMASRPRRSRACRCRGLQTCIHCSPSLLPEFQTDSQRCMCGGMGCLMCTNDPFSNPNPLVIEIPQPSASRVSTFKAEADLGECSICQERIMKGQLMCRLPCQDTVSHAFHRDCVKPWLDKHNTCPNCRSKI